MEFYYKNLGWLDLFFSLVKLKQNLTSKFCEQETMFSMTNVIENIQEFISARNKFNTHRKQIYSD